MDLSLALPLARQDRTVDSFFERIEEICAVWRSVGSGAAASRLVQLMPCPPLLCLQAQKDPRQKARHAKHEDLHGPLLSQKKLFEERLKFCSPEEIRNVIDGALPRQ